MKTSIIISLAAFASFLILPAVASAQEFLPSLLMPGSTEGTGIHFTITNSEYLNVSLQSTEEITITLESIPKTIDLLVRPSNLINSAVLTISNLEPNKTYYKFQDSYKNKAVFISDSQGSYSWVQDLTQFHHVWFQETSGTVSLSPQDCPNYGNWDEVNSTCTLTHDLAESVMAEADNITLDCAGHSITGSAGGFGIYINSRTGVIIKNCIVNNFSYGIFLLQSPVNSIINSTTTGTQIGIRLYDSSGNILFGNTAKLNNYYGILIQNGSNYNVVSGNTTNLNNLHGLTFHSDSNNNTLSGNTANSNNEHGIDIYLSSNNTLTGNTMSDNKYNFYLFGDADSHFLNAINTNNTVNGKPIYYIRNAINQTYGVSTNAGTFYCISCDSITLKDLTLIDNGLGVFFWKTNDSRIENITTSNSLYGIIIQHSDSNNLISNTANANEYGGIILISSSGNTLSGNTAKLNKYGGIQLYSSSNANILTDNILSLDKVGVGISLSASSDNKIHHNNFIDNYYKPQAYVSGGAGNLFDNGYPSGGNYWSDYKSQDQYSGPNQNQPGQDKIGDTSYAFIGGQDRYPFMEESGWKKKEVPLYTQVISQYPSVASTTEWSRERYGNGGIGGYTEHIVTFDNTDNYTLVINGKDDEAINSETGKKITAKVNACLYKIKDRDGDPNCVAEKMLSWPLGDNQYKSISVVLGRITAGSYFFRLTSKEDSFDLNNPGESGNLNIHLDWLKFTGASTAEIKIEAESQASINKIAGGIIESGGSGTVVRIDGYSCGRFIVDCGCAMVSMVMLGRYYDIGTGINGTEVTPLYMNDWLRKNNGYNKLGNLVWGKGKEVGAITYLGFKDPENITNVHLSLDVYNAATTSPAIDQYINSAKPAIVRNDKFKHYFIMDGKLADTYTIKDPSWYNTKTLNDERIGEYIKNYEGKIDAANLFSYLSVPKKIIAYSKSTQIYVASPVELLITDPQGRRLGKDIAAGMEYNEIPDATYTYETPPLSEEPSESEGAPRIKVADIPDTMDGQYNIKVSGTRAGSYTLEFFTNDTSGKVKDEIISGLIDADIVQDFEFNYSSQNIEETQVQQIVPIDIKPGSFPNSVNCKNSKEIIPVVILTTPLFDATAVDADTVRFGPVGAQETHGDKKTGKAQRHVEDVDNDGDLDLVFHFRFGDTGIQCRDGKAALTGLTIDGHNIMGTDTIRTVKVPYLLAGIIELPFQFFKSLAAKFVQWFNLLYDYFFSPKSISDSQPPKITREACLGENEEVWLVPQYWSYTYSYTHPYRSNEEFVEPLTMYIYSKELLKEALSQKGFSEDDMSRWVIENNNFNFNISNVPKSGDPPEIRKCGIYVRKFFKDSPRRYEAWKYDYSGRGERMMVLDAFDRYGASMGASSNADYQPLFKIDETETYVALVRSWYGEPEKHALVIKNLKTLDDVYVMTARELRERYGIDLGTIQLFDAGGDFVLFEVLNDERPWFRLNIETRKLERNDILP